jgi:DNA repair exonuclease SbcCD nuclease subunit
VRKADGIICSDIHLRLDVPECRTDNFLAAQSRKLSFISDLQQKHECPVLCGGDIYHHWKAVPQLLGMTCRELPRYFITIPGQHDLPAHSIENIERAGIDVLCAAGKIIMLAPSTELDIQIPCNSRNEFMWVSGFPWGEPLAGTQYSGINVALIHYLVFQGQEPFPGAAQVGGTGKAIIRQMPGFQLIVSGDNHQTFVERVGGTVLVNPGSMMRQTAAQADHKPCVFLWYADTNEVEQVFLPIENDVISREHIDVKTEKNERLEAYVKSLATNITVSLSFEDNMKVKIAASGVRTPVQKLIYKAMGK